MVRGPLEPVFLQARRSAVFHSCHGGTRSAESVFSEASHTRIFLSTCDHSCHTPIVESSSAPETQRKPVFRPVFYPGAATRLETNPLEGKLGHPRRNSSHGRLRHCRPRRTEGAEGTAMKEQTEDPSPDSSGNEGKKLDSFFDL